MPRCLLLALLLLGGCRGAGDPSVRTIGASVLEVDDAATQIGIDLVLENPADEPVQMLEFDYSVSSGGRNVFRGRRAALVTVDRRSRRVVTVPAVIRHEQLGRVDGPTEAFDYAVSGTLLYILPGALNRTLMEIGLRRPRVSFQGRGTVNVGPDGVASAR